MADEPVLRLQAIVSREVASTDIAVDRVLRGVAATAGTDRDPVTEIERFPVVVNDPSSWAGRRRSSRSG